MFKHTYMPNLLLMNYKDDLNRLNLLLTNYKDDFLTSQKHIQQINVALFDSNYHMPHWVILATYIFLVFNMVFKHYIKQVFQPKPSFRFWLKISHIVEKKSYRFTVLRNCQLWSSQSTNQVRDDSYQNHFWISAWYVLQTLNVNLQKNLKIQTALFRPNIF